MRAVVLRKAAGALQRLTVAAWIAAVGFLILMLGLMTLQISARYLPGPGAPSFTEEAARYAMVWSGLLGGAAAFGRGADPATVTISAQSAPWRRRLHVWGSALLVLVVLGPLLVASPGFLARAALRATASLGWNLGLVVAIVPLYAGLTIALAVLRVIVFELDPGGNAAMPRDDNKQPSEGPPDDAN